MSQQHYNQGYTKAQVIELLQSIQDCVTENHYSISLSENREENRKFIQDYNLNSSRRRAILLQIKPEDFCHSLQNTNVGFEHEVLFVFVPQVTLFDFDGNEELVDVYVKFNLIEMPYGNRAVAISFHKRNKPISYIFR